MTREVFTPAKSDSAQAGGSVWLLIFAAWLIALAASLGAIFIGEIMGKTPCLLCWYQRACMFPLAILLGVASYYSDGAVWRYALPIAALGGAIAAYHNLLLAGIIPETIQPCTDTGPSCASMDLNIVGFIPIPLLSLAAFGFLTMLLILLRRSAHD